VAVNELHGRAITVMLLDFVQAGYGLYVGIAVALMGADTSGWASCWPRCCSACAAAGRRGNLAFEVPCDHPRDGRRNPGSGNPVLRARSNTSSAAVTRLHRRAVRAEEPRRRRQGD
jgi:hypothetical protein